MSRKIDHNHYKKLFQKDSFTNYITQLYIIVYENLFTRDDSFLVDKNSHKNSINISQNNNIKMPDRKYFHNTLYADYHKNKFGIQLIPNTPIFNLCFDMLSTLIKFYFGLIHYQPNQPKRCENLQKILKCCLFNYKNKIQKSYDLFLIELYEKMELWYDELLDMEKIGKYNFISLEKEVKEYVDILTYSNLLNINYKQKKEILYKNDKKYHVARFNIYENGEINHHKSIYQKFKKKYNQELKVVQYDFILDILYLICFIHKKEYTDIRNILYDFFTDYPELIKTNDDFDENYKMLMTINQYLEKGNEEEIKTMLNSLIIKNIFFLEECERN